ncbi:MAG: DNA recombination protein RmuC [Clostridia bacterium]|nr:DNA recombination protein RmuC [Clostridia bacterium]
MKEAWMIPALLLLAGCFVLLLLLLRRQRTQQMASGSLETRLKTLEDLLRNAEKSSAALQGRQDILAQSVETSLSRLQTQQADAAMQTEQKLEQLRRSMTESLNHMQTASQLQLDGIRRTVDEKLQETLDRKLSESFQQVSQRLEAVYKGLGEMQSLAAGVGDLKKVLSNVKTRGILGEIQLGAILEQILSPEQYAANVATKKGSQANVEYAVRLPGSDGRPVWLPVDAKFPLDAYQQLLDAYDAADPALVDSAKKMLFQRVKGFAKEVRTKYIDPPNTTDFAILFIPTEGLYAELIRGGMAETLQRDYQVTLAGPTTMSALLNSLQMGFRTLAIQKRSGEVWKVLGAVKTEFNTFASVLESTQKRLAQAGDDLDKLVGVRTRKIQSTLKQVEALPAELLPAVSPEENDDV